MKNSMLVLSLVITLVCGFVLFQKNRDVAAARARLAVAEQQREALAAQAAQLEKKNTGYQARLHESRAEALDKTVEVRNLQQQLARTPAGNPEDAGLSGLFRDEAMKGVLKEEAKAGIARNIKKLFAAGLAQQLHLDDNQGAALKQLLTQKESIFWNQMLIPMTTGELDDAGMAQAGKDIKRALEENMAQTRALLGEDGYNAYQRFEKSQPERDHLSEFSSRVEETGQDLSTGQRSELLALMIDERLNFKFQSNLDDPTQLNFEHWDENFTEQRINAYAQEMEQLDDRIVARAQSVLTPEQAVALKDFLAQELARAKFTMRTTTLMTAKHH